MMGTPAQISYLCIRVKNCVYMYLLASYHILLQMFMPHRRPTGLQNRKGHVAIVTGGTRGIGLEVVRQFLSLGMHVTVGCRNSEDNANVLRKLELEYPDSKINSLELDLSSLESTRHFAAAFIRTGSPLHVLVNNAGIMFPPYSLTKDGFESQFGVNYLSHFLLTHLLLPKLRETGTPEVGARIVNVSSVAAYTGHINFDDLQYSKFYTSHGCYSQSKLAQIMHARSLQERLTAEGAQVTISSLHPGVIYTELYQHIWWKNLFPSLVQMVFKNAKQGSDTVVHVAASSTLEGIGGKYYQNCRSVVPPKLVFDESIRSRLWDESCKLVDIQ